jgi:DNA-binding transcriptional regulator GbsR (MarR family)
VSKQVKDARKARKGRGARALERRVTHAVSHPVRLDALSIFFERMASPKEISKHLEVSLGTVSFHVNELLADDAIELVKTVQRRGAIEHYYKAKMRPEISDAELRALPKATRRKFAALILQAIIAEGLSSLRHEKMDEDDQLNLIWMPITLDAEGRREVSAIQAEMLERLEDVKTESELRLAAGEDISERIVAMMSFERGQPGRPHDAGTKVDVVAK